MSLKNNSRTVRYKSYDYHVPRSPSSSFSSRKAGKVRCRSYCRQRTRWWNAIWTASASISWESWENGWMSRSCLKKCRISDAFAIQNASDAGLSRLSWKQINNLEIENNLCYLPTRNQCVRFLTMYLYFVNNLTKQPE